MATLGMTAGYQVVSKALSERRLQLRIKKTLNFLIKVKLFSIKMLRSCSEHFVVYIIRIKLCSFVGLIWL